MFTFDVCTIPLTLAHSGEDEQNRDFDFLSSIEVLLVMQGDVIEMQNWDHLRDMVSSLLDELLLCFIFYLDFKCEPQAIEDEGN